ncbi:HNH endonuclease signature motif containing protein [Chroococcidiopsis sp. CCALA 051]|uniref:HNH endonuclease n=1 Tax=Chroococcidiopsis sp. CCALA 051 TaxID=869949 RepID=UPI0011B26F28
MKCKHCGQTTINPAFCSRSCAASYNNQKFPKKRKGHKPRYCKHCRILVTGRRTTCDICNPSYVDWSCLTLSELRAKALYQHSARVRQVARNVYRRSNQPKQCIICGYNKHYEVCHIRPIQDFAEDTPIAQINDINNLVALCPNHHWEFDRGLLTF